MGSNLGKYLISGYTEDLPAQAKTGSGKTAAYGIGSLHILNVKRFNDSLGSAPDQTGVIVAHHGILP